MHRFEAVPGPDALDADLVGKNAGFSNPAAFVGLVEWADKVLTE